MLDKEIRTAVFTLHKKGHGRREIGKVLGISRNSVKRILRSGMVEVAGLIERASRLDEHLEDVRALCLQCRKKNGKPNLVRVKQELKQRQIDVHYSTLTRFCREQGIGVKPKVPVRRIVTDPGIEMQHDTSPHTIVIGGKKVKRQCASLILGYSRMLYITFFRRFTRFEAKIFLTAAFGYFHGLCRRCIVDNTSVIVARGTGALAEMAPEVEAFEKRFGFRFIAHELGHAERSGKIERPFHWVENNMLVGRTFKDDEDLNRQALQWLEETANVKRKRELKASPVELFAAEKPHLVPLPIFVPEVYRTHLRVVDVYGCVSLHGQKYPVPAAYISKTVQIRETQDRVVTLDGHKELADHKKKLEGSPPEPSPPHAPRRQRQAKLVEEDKLKEMGAVMCAYLQALKAARKSRYVWSLKKLYRLLCQYEAKDIEHAVARAAEYRLFDVRRIENIILQDLAERDYLLPLGGDNQDYEQWSQYQQGAQTPEPDLSRYDPGPEQGEDDDR